MPVPAACWAVQAAGSTSSATLPADFTYVPESGSMLAESCNAGQMTSVDPQNASDTNAYALRSDLISPSNLLSSMSGVTSRVNTALPRYGRTLGWIVLNCATGSQQVFQPT